MLRDLLSLRGHVHRSSAQATADVCASAAVLCRLNNNASQILLLKCGPCFLSSTASVRFRQSGGRQEQRGASAGAGGSGGGGEAGGDGQAGSESGAKRQRGSPLSGEEQQDDVAAASEEPLRPPSEEDGSAGEDGNLPSRGTAGMPPPSKLDFDNDLGTGITLGYSHYNSPVYGVRCDPGRAVRVLAGLSVLVLADVHCTNDTQNSRCQGGHRPAPPICASQHHLRT